MGGEPSLTSRFLFEVDGVEIGLFGSIKGLQVSATVEEVVEGGQNGFTHKLPGRLEWPSITFSRGLTQADALFEWMNKTSGEGFAAAGNTVVRRSGAITAISSAGDRLRSWNLEAVMPIRWKGPDFDVDNSNALSEELEIVHHGFVPATKK
ncbi:phage tail protein [Nakamurella antarctica]|uniref:phage tail protein n=1 Tax=Nakamurella antarctica TaxID=1902245 RepID=UPI001EEFD19C|nr:phage tail protein [Nakamurella antarctica]